MPKVSLVVCLRQEVQLLERLLKHASGCYDDLVVVHDGPEEGLPGHSRPSIPRNVLPPACLWPGIAGDYSKPVKAEPVARFWKEGKEPLGSGSIQHLVQSTGGRFFQGPRCFQQEPHWPFAWSQARHDWILRLDADEFPGDQLKQWLMEFRKAPEPEDISGYCCAWPLWDGQRTVSDKWPDGRIFLFHRQRVRFFGMVEQSPVADRIFSRLDIPLNHQPSRKSYGLRNILTRRQAYRWREVIALSLLGSPLDLPRWRWTDQAWPSPWRQIRSQPFRYAVNAIVFMPLHTTKAMLKLRIRPRPGIIFQSAIHHCLLALRYWQLSRRKGSKNTRDETPA